MGRIPISLYPAAGLIPALVVISFAIQFSASGQLQAIFTETLIYMVMVVALSIFVGNSGIISFGHVAFAMIGAYASAWQTCCSGMRSIFMPALPEAIAAFDMPVVVAAIGAAAGATVVAALCGLVLMRLASVAASIALLSSLFVFKTIYENWDGMTAGQSSIVGLPLYVEMWVALFWVAICVVVAQFYKCSSNGLRLRAARDDEIAAQGAGVVVWKERLLAFCISAFFFAIGGVLFGHFLGTLTVNMFWLNMTFLTLAMLVVGGIRSITGAVVGTLVIATMRGVLRAAEQGVDLAGVTMKLPEGMQEITLAVVLLSILMFRPQGIVGERELGLRSPT